MTVGTERSFTHKFAEYKKEVERGAVLFAFECSGEITGTLAPKQGGETTLKLDFSDPAAVKVAVEQKFKSSYGEVTLSGSPPSLGEPATVEVGIGREGLFSGDKFQLTITAAADLSLTSSLKYSIEIEEEVGDSRLTGTLTVSLGVKLGLSRQGKIQAGIAASTGASRLLSGARAAWTAAKGTVVVAQYGTFTTLGIVAVGAAAGGAAIVAVGAGLYFIGKANLDGRALHCTIAWVNGYAEVAAWMTDPEHAGQVADYFEKGILPFSGPFFGSVTIPDLAAYNAAGRYAEGKHVYLEHEDPNGLVLCTQAGRASVFQEAGKFIRLEKTACWLRWCQLQVLYSGPSEWRRRDAWKNRWLVAAYRGERIGLVFNSSMLAYFDPLLREGSLGATTR